MIIILSNLILFVILTLCESCNFFLQEDDGLRLNFLARLLGDLYPSEELSDDFATVRRGEVSI